MTLLQSFDIIAQTGAFLWVRGVAVILTQSGRGETVLFWARGVAVNMSPCRGEDRRFESGRARFHLAEVIQRRRAARLQRGKPA